MQPLVSKLAALTAAPDPAHWAHIATRPCATQAAHAVCAAPACVNLPLLVRPCVPLLLAHAVQGLNILPVCIHGSTCSRVLGHLHLLRQLQRSRLVVCTPGLVGSAGGHLCSAGGQGCCPHDGSLQRAHSAAVATGGVSCALASVFCLVGRTEGGGCVLSRGTSAGSPQLTNTLCAASPLVVAFMDPLLFALHAGASKETLLV